MKAHLQTSKGEDKQTICIQFLHGAHTLTLWTVNSLFTAILSEVVSLNHIDVVYLVCTYLLLYMNCILHMK